MPIPINSKLVRYVISGTVSAAVNLTLTWVLELFGMHYIAVVTVAFICSLVISFILQKFFTFGSKGITGTHTQFALFTVIAGINLAVNDSLVYVQYTLFRFRHLVLEQAVASAVIALYSYFLYRHLFVGKIGTRVALPIDE